MCLGGWALLIGLSGVGGIVVLDVSYVLSVAFQFYRCWGVIHVFWWDTDCFEARVYAIAGGNRGSLVYQIARVDYMGFDGCIGYDLVAVLAPGGPIKLLVELAWSRNEELPALVYEARLTVSHNEGKQRSSLGLLVGGVSDSGSVELQVVSNNNVHRDGSENRRSPEYTAIQVRSLENVKGERKRDEVERLSLVGHSSEGYSSDSNSSEYSTVIRNRESEIVVDDEMSPLVDLLGMDDEREQVRRDGLGCTLILLSVSCRALPALPISITLGEEEKEGAILFVPKNTDDFVGKSWTTQGLTPEMTKTIVKKTEQRKQPLKSSKTTKECRKILCMVEAALPSGMPQGIAEDSKLQETFHKALELLPNSTKKIGFLDEAVTAYCQALGKSWELNPQRLANVQDT
ncbi:hypothetical protein CRYUN_Cryun08bG0047900 [Craigia yunnanensis]